MLRLLYKEIPPDTQKACELAVYFLNCGEEKEGEAGSPARRIYSFAKDAKYIYSAIRQTHGIDLETVKYLHWWKFCYFFLDLDPDCMFQQMLHLRQQKQQGKLTKEERRCITACGISSICPARRTHKRAARRKNLWQN